MGWKLCSQRPPHRFITGCDAPFNTCNTDKIKIMNRPIKFRAWDDSHKEFNPTVAANLLLALHEPSEDVDPEYGKRFFLSEYTGLTDKNGDDIYEGDIVRNRDGLFTIENWGDGVFRIVTNGMTWQWLHQANSNGYLQYGDGNYEVIGNVFENPELLSSTPTPEVSDTTDGDSSTGA